MKISTRTTKLALAVGFVVTLLAGMIVTSPAVRAGEDDPVVTPTPVPQDAQPTSPGGDGTSSTEDLGGSEHKIKMVDETVGFNGGRPETSFRTAVSKVNPPCKVWSTDAASGTSTTAPTDGQSEEEKRKAREEELLNASTFGRNGSTPRSKSILEPGVMKQPDVHTPAETETKPVKSAASNRLGARVAFQVHEVDAEAVKDLFDQIAEEEANSGGPGVPVEPTCLVPYICSGERVDDVLFGEISNAPSGGYAAYINQVADIIAAVGSIIVPYASITVDRDKLAGDIATNGFGDQPSVEYMPVFYFCRVGDANGPIEVADLNYNPSFEWATTITDQYDVPGARVTSLETLNTLLQGNRPEMQTIPPVERGYTFVQLPMWLWLENIDNLEAFRIDAVSEQNTVRLATRATLTGITWKLGDETVSCQVEDMTPFIHGTSSITDAAPKCSYMFDELRDYRMTATAHYVLEEQLSYRGSDTYAWPTAAWLPHPTTPTAQITNQTGVMQVREIAAVNATIDFDASSTTDD